MTARRPMMAGEQDNRARGGDGAARTDGDPVRALFDRGSFARSYRPGETIAAEGDPSAFFYLVEEGTLRLGIFTDCGRRQVLDFPTRGDIIGLSWRTTCGASAEALDSATLRLLPRDRFEQRIARDPQVGEAVRREICTELARRERHLLRIARHGATERLEDFLQEFAARQGNSAGLVSLPMTREDLGDHLGLSLETVSRSFAALRRANRLLMVGPTRYAFTPGRPLGTVA